MKDTEFNLIDEPWIRVLDGQCRLRDVSIREAILDAHLYTGIKGELPTQDAAILRVLLAILYRIYLKKDLDGNDAPIKDKDDAIDRWTELWEGGKFPAAPINEYLDKWHDRFWLFDPDYPFFQVPDLEGSEFTAKKLNGRVAMSENKSKLYHEGMEETYNTLAYPEAARWLVCINAYDDTSNKPFKKNKSEKYPSTGVGWLGKIGLVYPEGDNLFETLVLNLAFLKNGEDLWNPGRPVWENNSPKRDQRTEIPLPENPCELLTLQSRRLLLKRTDGAVTGFIPLGGDFFSIVNADSEQMTAWTAEKKGKKPTGNYAPKRHDIKKAAWREFPSLFTEAEGKKPGIVKWIEGLSRNGEALEDRFVRFRTVAVVYGNQNSMVDDIYSDTIEMHSGILKDLAQKDGGWIGRIQEEVEKCEKAACILQTLERRIRTASGESQGGKKKPKEPPPTALEQFFAEIDIPFRGWLRSLDPTVSLMESENRGIFKNWEETAYRIASNVGSTVVNDAGPDAFKGRWIKLSDAMKKKLKKEKEFYSSPSAYNAFKYSLRKIYPQKKGDQDE